MYCTIGRMAALCPRSTFTCLHDKPRGWPRDALPCIPLSQEIRGSVIKAIRKLRIDFCNFDSIIYQGIMIPLKNEPGTRFA